MGEKTRAGWRKNNIAVIAAVGMGNAEPNARAEDFEADGPYNRRADGYLGNEMRHIRPKFLKNDHKETRRKKIKAAKKARKRNRK